MLCNNKNIPIISEFTVVNAQLKVMKTKSILHNSIHTNRIIVITNIDVE